MCRPTKKTGGAGLRPTGPAFRTFTLTSGVRRCQLATICRSIRPPDIFPAHSQRTSDNALQAMRSCVDRVTGAIPTVPSRSPPGGPSSGPAPNAGGRTQTNRFDQAGARWSDRQSDRPTRPIACSMLRCVGPTHFQATAKLRRDMLLRDDKSGGGPSAAMHLPRPGGR